MLTAKRHWSAEYLILVLSDSLTVEQGNVVAKHNTKIGKTWRTNHVGPKPALSDIRAAIAAAVQA